MMVRISSLDRILSIRAFCTLRIFPRSGRIAWKVRSRPCLAEPPAESPSTRYSSVSLGSVTLQSASLPGSNPPSRPLRLRTSSRALRAASRARAALTAFAMMVRATLGLLSKKSPSASLTTLFTIPSTSELASLVLVCPSNWGSFTFTCSTAVRPARMSSPVRVNSSFSRGLEHDRLGVQGLAVAEQVLHELGEAALVEERLLLLLPLALVLERDREGLVQERELAQPGGDRGVVEARLGEDLRVGLEPDGRACALRLADDLQPLGGFAPLERHVVPLPVAVHPHLELFRQRVHDRYADAVQPARDFVRALVELTPGVQHRQRHLDAGLFLGLVNIDRDAAAI